MAPLTMAGRLEIALGAKEGATKAGLARHCGVTKQAVTAWFQEPSSLSDPRKLIKAAEYLSVSPAWLSAEGNPVIEMGYRISQLPAEGQREVEGVVLKWENKRKVK